MLKPSSGRPPTARLSVEVDFARHYYEAVRSDHWWFHGRRELVRSLLSRLTLSGQTVLDLGAGSDSLFPSSLEVIKLDMVKPEGDLGKFVKGSATALPFRAGAFHGVGAFDLIEHVGDTHRMMEELRRVVIPNGFIVATVPAHQWLWSMHDQRAGHVRRYSAESLRRLFEDSGFTLEWLGYFYGFLLIPAILRRLFGLRAGVDMPRDALNRVLSHVSRRSVARALRSRRPGLSIGVLARSPNQPAELMFD